RAPQGYSWGEPLAPMSHDRGLAGFEAGLGAEIFGGVRRRAAGQAVVVLPGRLERHQLGGFQLHPAFGERMRDRRVLADRPGEHDALFRVSTCAPERGAAEADRFDADQDALRIETVEDIFKTVAFLADAVLDRHVEAVDENLIGVDRLPSHLLDLAHLDEAAVERGEEQGET